jgi:hypothetical protein
MPIMAAQEYLILIIEQPWNPQATSQADFDAEMVHHRAFQQAVRDAGQQITASNALDGPETAVRIDPARDGGSPVFTDAPFSELKEVVSGYYQITADSREQALELAAQCPTGGHLEVFPIFVLPTF